MLYPKPAPVKQLRLAPALLRAVWYALTQISTDDLIGEGRVYGGGLHKLEPNELRNASAEGILAGFPELNTEQLGQGLLFTT
jgi:hypothetical protein